MPQAPKKASSPRPRPAGRIAPRPRAPVFITGASGFVGRALMTRFAALGAEVRGVDLVADPARNVVAGNVAAAGAWQRHAAGCELVIHAAAVVSNAAPAQLYREVSLGSVRHALDAAIAGGASRFVQVSSIAAYGLDFDGVRDERAPIALLSGYPYCDAKAASEHPALAAHAAGEIACTVIRPGDVYGPGSRPWVLLPLEMMRKHQFLLPAGGNGVFSPVYIDTLVDGIVAAATQPAGAGQIFNLTDGVDVSCREFFGYHHRWLGRRGDPLILPTAAARAIITAGEVVMNRVLKQHTEISAGSLAMLMRRGSYSIDKAQSLLGYAPQVSLAEGMQRTEAWLREQGLIGR